MPPVFPFGTLHNESLKQNNQLNENDDYYNIHENENENDDIIENVEEDLQENFEVCEEELNKPTKLNSNKEFEDDIDDKDDENDELKKIEQQIEQLKNKIIIGKKRKLSKNVLNRINNKTKFKITNNKSINKLEKLKNVSKSVLKIIGKSCQFSALIGISSFISYSLIGNSNNLFSNILRDTIFSSTRIISDIYMTMQKNEVPSIIDYLQNSEQIVQNNNKTESQEQDNFEKNSYFTFTSPFEWLTLNK